VASPGLAQVSPAGPMAVGVVELEQATAAATTSETNANENAWRVTSRGFTATSLCKRARTRRTTRPIGEARLALVMVRSGAVNCRTCPLRPSDAWTSGRIHPSVTVYASPRLSASRPRARGMHLGSRRHVHQHGPSHVRGAAIDNGHEQVRPASNRCAHGAAATAIARGTGRTARDPGRVDLNSRDGSFVGRPAVDARDGSRSVVDAQRPGRPARNLRDQQRRLLHGRDLGSANEHLGRRDDRLHRSVISDPVSGSSRLARFAARSGSDFLRLGFRPYATGSSA
jgi:hypothetical protein